MTEDDPRVSVMLQEHELMAIYDSLQIIATSMRTAAPERAIAHDRALMLDELRVRLYTEWHSERRAHERRMTRDAAARHEQTRRELLQQELDAKPKPKRTRVKR